jgi:hypothetical protein
MTLALWQLFKNSIDTQEKLRLNLHSLSVSVSVSELVEYGRQSMPFKLDLIHSLVEKSLENLKSQHY